MEQNPITDIQAQYKQQKLENSLNALTKELVKVNAQLAEIKKLLEDKEDNSDAPKSKPTYIG